MWIDIGYFQLRKKGLGTFHHADRSGIARGKDTRTVPALRAERNRRGVQLGVMGSSVKGGCEHVGSQGVVKVEGGTTEVHVGGAEEAGTTVVFIHGNETFGWLPHRPLPLLLFVHTVHACVVLVKHTVVILTREQEIAKFYKS